MSDRRTADESAFVQGARLFDAGAFFDAHEIWEDEWRGLATSSSAALVARRTLLQGLIQIAAALHKLLVMNGPEAAGRLFTRALAKLDASSVELERAEGFDLAAFRDGCRRCAAELARGQFDRTRIPIMLVAPPAGGPAGR